MPAMQLENFDIENFLTDYWQQKHLFLPHAISHWESPIDGDDLAGLSLEPDVESRLIINEGTSWSMEHGPLTEERFSTLPQSHWTLLVQAVDHWIDDINALKGLFDFLPSWRLDDIMISYSPIGGSVGPHFDQYDVFLLQASGTREWKIGQLCTEQTETICPAGITQITDFKEQACFQVEAGDLLYIPPGVAHWGTASSDDCITISIGFRAPSHEEIIGNLCDEVASHLSSALRYNDPQLDVNTPKACINQAVIDKLQAVVLKHLNNPNVIAKSFGQIVTSPKYPDQIENSCTGPLLRIKPESRFAYHKTNTSILAFSNGSTFEYPLTLSAFIESIESENIINTETLSADTLSVINDLVSTGLFEDVDD